MPAAPAPIALIDGNNFAYRPDRRQQLLRLLRAGVRQRLEGVPAVVLTNNNGCAVVRSEKAEALGMGASAFQLRDFIARHRIRVFSSNYPLCGDMSRRVNAVLAAFSPELEVYSIGETFLGLDGLGMRDLGVYGQELRATVRCWTSIPTCVGIGPTKRLPSWQTQRRRSRRPPEMSGR